MKTQNKLAAICLALLLLLPCLAPICTQAAEHPSLPYHNHQFPLQGQPGIKPIFNQAESACIQQSKIKPITVGLIPDLFPISVYDTQTQKFTGILVEMMKLISQKTGLVFAYQPIHLEVQAPITSLKNHDTPLVAGILKTQAFLNDPELILSDDLFDASLIFVGLNDENFITDGKTKTIAVLAGFQVAKEYAQQVFPTYKIELYPTTQACLDAVVKGKADITLHTKYGLNYLLQNPHYEKLEMISAYTSNFYHCIAGISPDSAVLMSVIDKGLAAISGAEYNYVLVNYTIANSYQMTTGDLIYKYRIPFAIILALLLFIIIGAILVSKNRHKNTLQLQAAYAQTKEALAIAQHASEAKGQFTAKMSHEIRTPLNAVTGYLNIAKNSISNPEKLYDCIEKSELAAKYLLAVVNDVLDISSIESGKIKIAHSRFDLNQLIAEATTIFTAQAEQKGIQFKVTTLNLPKESLLGDSLRLKQILINLLGNACKFTPKGGKVNLFVEQLIHQGNKVYFRFTVEDNGIGISKEFMAGLFTAYEQEDAAISQNHGGTGLGLAITQSLVKLMGGTIHAESEKNHGATFQVELPFELDISQSLSSTNQNPNGNANFAGKRLLLAEDNEMNCEIVTEILTTYGFIIDSAVNGKKVVEKFLAAANNYYGAILMDIQMPELNGYEATKAIRASNHSEAKTIPIIAMTANAFAEDISASLAAGMNDHIAKPLDIEELLSVLNKLLK